MIIISEKRTLPGEEMFIDYLTCEESRVEYTAIGLELSTNVHTRKQ